ncbi:hypothetical protein U0070_000724, partial [Myodes glareolus]
IHYFLNGKAKREWIRSPNFGTSQLYNALVLIFKRRVTEHTAPGAADQRLHLAAEPRTDRQTVVRADAAAICRPPGLRKEGSGDSCCRWVEDRRLIVALPELDAVWGPRCLSEVIPCSLSPITISSLGFLLLISVLKPAVPRHARNASVQLSHVFCWFASHKQLVACQSQDVRHRFAVPSISSRFSFGILLQRAYSNLRTFRTSSMERQCQAPADWNRASYLALAGCVPALSLRLNQLVPETGPVISHGGRISHCAWKLKALLGKDNSHESLRRLVLYTPYGCGQDHSTGHVDEMAQVGEMGPETAGNHYIRKLKGNTRFCNYRVYSLAIRKLCIGGFRVVPRHVWSSTGSHGRDDGIADTLAATVMAMPESRHLDPITYSIGYLSSPAILHTKQGAHKVPTDIHQHTFAPCNSYFTFTDDSSVTDIVLPVTVLKFPFPHLPFKDHAHLYFQTKIIMRQREEASSFGLEIKIITPGRTILGLLFISVRMKVSIEQCINRQPSVPSLGFSIPHGCCEEDVRVDACPGGAFPESRQVLLSFCILQSIFGPHRWVWEMKIPRFTFELKLMCIDYHHNGDSEHTHTKEFTEFRKVTKAEECHSALNEMFYPSKIRDQGSVPQLSGETMVTVQCTDQSNQSWAALSLCNCCNITNKKKKPKKEKKKEKKKAEAQLLLEVETFPGTRSGIFMNRSSECSKLSQEVDECLSCAIGINAPQRTFQSTDGLGTSVITKMKKYLGPTWVGRGGDGWRPRRNLFLWQNGNVRASEAGLTHLAASQNLLEALNTGLTLSAMLASAHIDLPAAGKAVTSSCHDQDDFVEVSDSPMESRVQALTAWIAPGCPVGAEQKISFVNLEKWRMMEVTGHRLKRKQKVGIEHIRLFLVFQGSSCTHLFLRPFYLLACVITVANGTVNLVGRTKKTKNEGQMKEAAVNLSPTIDCADCTQDNTYNQGNTYFFPHAGKINLTAFNQTGSVSQDATWFPEERRETMTLDFEASLCVPVLQPAPLSLCCCVLFSPQLRSNHVCSGAFAFLLSAALISRHPEQCFDAVFCKPIEVLLIFFFSLPLSLLFFLPFFLPSFLASFLPSFLPSFFLSLVIHKGTPWYNLDHIGTVGVPQTDQEESQIKSNPWTPPGSAVPLGEPREALPQVLQDPEDISPRATHLPACPSCLCFSLPASSWPPVGVVIAHCCFCGRVWVAVHSVVEDVRQVSVYLSAFQPVHSTHSPGPRFTMMRTPTPAQAHPEVSLFIEHQRKLRCKSCVCAAFDFGSLLNLAPPTLDQRYLSLHLTESERQQAWDLGMVEMCFMPEGGLRVLLISASQPGSSLQLPDHVYLSAAYPTLVDQVLSVCGTLPQERSAPTSLSTWTSATMCLGASCHEDQTSSGTIHSLQHSSLAYHMLHFMMEVEMPGPAGVDCHVLCGESLEFFREGHVYPTLGSRKDFVPALQEVQTPTISSTGICKQEDGFELFAVTGVFSFHALSLCTKRFTSSLHPSSSFPDVLKQYQLTQFAPERFRKKNERLNTPEVKKKLKKLNNAEILSPAIGVIESSQSPPTGTEFTLKQMKTIRRNIGKKNDSSKTEYTQEAFQGFHRQSWRSATPEICGWRSLCSLHVGSKCQSNPWDQNAALVTEVSLGEKHNVALYSVRAKEASTPKHRLESAQKVNYFFLSTILCCLSTSFNTGTRLPVSFHVVAVRLGEQLWLPIATNFGKKLKMYGFETSPSPGLIPQRLLLVFCVSPCLADQGGRQNCLTWVFMTDVKYIDMCCEADHLIGKEMKAHQEDEWEASLKGFLVSVKRISTDLDHRGLPECTPSWLLINKAILQCSSVLCVHCEETPNSYESIEKRRRTWLPRDVHLLGWVEERGGKVFHLRLESVTGHAEELWALQAHRVAFFKYFTILKNGLTQARFKNLSATVMERASRRRRARVTVQAVKEESRVAQKIRELPRLPGALRCGQSSYSQTLASPLLCALRQETELLEALLAHLPVSTLANGVCAKLKISSDYPGDFRNHRVLLTSGTQRPLFSVPFVTRSNSTYLGNVRRYALLLTECWWVAQREPFAVTSWSLGTFRVFLRDRGKGEGKQTGRSPLDSLYDKPTRQG